MNSYDAPIISREPGPIKRILIFLAGGNPSLFTRVPEGEGDDFAVLGLIVLIPATLAITAGTFTLMTYQKTHDLASALVFGVIWSAIILILDVVVMRQLTKSASIARPSPRPRRPLVGAGVPRRPVDTDEDYYIRRKPGARWPAVAIRLAFSLVLGAFMSHCLLLTIFDKDIAKQLSFTRTAEKNRIEEMLTDSSQEEKDRARAASIRAITDDTELLEKFRIYREDQASRTPAGKSPITDSGLGTIPSTSNSPNFAPLAMTGQDAFTRRKKELEDDVLTLEVDVKKKAIDYADHAKRVDEWRLDLQNAKQMLSYERTGLGSRDFIFKSIEFKELGQTTSGIEGQGVRCKRIQDFMAAWEPKIKDHEASLKEEKTALEKAKADLETSRSTTKMQIGQEQQRLYESGLKSQDDAGTRIKKEAEVARSDLNDEVQRLGKVIEDAKNERTEKLAAFEGKASDIGEKSDAFHVLLFGGASAEKQEHGRGTFLGVAVVLFLALLLLDLAPLIFKSLKEPGVYERVRQKLSDYDPFAQTVTSSATTAHSSDPIDYFTSGPKPPRAPPPPRQSPLN